MVRIISECYAETIVVEILCNQFEISCEKQHSSGIQEVSKILSKNIASSQILIGWVDKDKCNNPIYLSEFEIIISNSNFTFKKHKLYNQFLVVVNKGIETLILNGVKELELNIEDYNFSNHVKHLSKFTKKTSIANNVDYKRLINDFCTLKFSSFIELQKQIKLITKNLE